MASLTQWTGAWVNSRNWWRTGKPSVLQFMVLQRVGYDWATEVNLTEDRAQEIHSCVQVKNHLSNVYFSKYHLCATYSGWPCDVHLFFEQIFIQPFLCFTSSMWKQSFSSYRVYRMVEYRYYTNIWRWCKSKKKNKGGEGTEELSERSGKIWHLSKTCMKRGLRPCGHLGKGLPGTWKRQGKDVRWVCPCHAQRRVTHRGWTGMSDGARQEMQT